MTRDLRQVPLGARTGGTRSPLHVVHDSLMSQQSEKFPLTSFCFTTLIKMICTGWDWSKEI
jgi:hypothetical protein